MKMLDPGGRVRSLADADRCESCAIKSACGAKALLPTGSRVSLRTGGEPRGGSPAGRSGNGPNALSGRELPAGHPQGRGVLADGQQAIRQGKAPAESERFRCCGRRLEAAPPWRPPGCTDLAESGQESGCGCRGNGGPGQCNCPKNQSCPHPLSAASDRDMMAILGPDGQPLSGAFSVLARSALSHFSTAEEAAAFLSKSAWRDALPAMVQVSPRTKVNANCDFDADGSSEPPTQAAEIDRKPGPPWWRDPWWRPPG